MRIGIIGGGPAGYVAAIRAAQLGAEVTLFERENLGGVCTNHGCIPTKALYSLARKVSAFHWGILQKIWYGELEADWRKAIDFKNAVVTRSRKGIEYLLTKRCVQVVHSEAKFLEPNVVSVVGRKDIWEFEKILVATGSVASIPPVDGLSGISPWDNCGALSAPSVPAKLIILGAGVVGVEMAHIFATFGSEVFLVELLPRILPTMDAEISAAVHRALSSEGVKIFSAKKAVEVHRRSDGSVVMELESGESIEAEQIIVATGRKPVLPEGIEQIGVRTQKGFIIVDKNLRTSVGNIWSAGDVVGEPLLAHKASHQGIRAIEDMFGIEQVEDVPIPSAIFTAIEVGTVGLTEPEAKQKYGDGIKVGSFPYIASGRAHAEGETAGTIKIVADPSGKIVGFHAIGAEASELLSVGTLIVANGMPLSDVEKTIFAHPTLGEMIHEAALSALGKPLHIV